MTVPERPLALQKLTVLEGEGQRDGFREGDLDIEVWLLHIGMTSKGDSSIANVAGAGEFDAIL